MKRIRIHSPGRATKLYLRIALPLILLVTVALLLSYLDARAINPVKANNYYPDLMEYIFASLAVTAGGAFLLEVAEWDQKKNDP